MQDRLRRLTLKKLSVSSSITVFFPIEEIKKVCEYCDYKQCTQSQFIRNAIKDYYNIIEEPIKINMTHPEKRGIIAKKVLFNGLYLTKSVLHGYMKNLFLDDIINGAFKDKLMPDHNKFKTTESFAIRYIIHTYFIKHPFIILTDDDIKDLKWKVNCNGYELGKYHLAYDFSTKTAIVKNNGVVIINGIIVYTKDDLEDLMKISKIK